MKAEQNPLDTVVKVSIRIGTVGLALAFRRPPDTAVSLWRYANTGDTPVLRPVGARDWSRSFNQLLNVHVGFVRVSVQHEFQQVDPFGCFDRLVVG